jgi:hypothetical protein
MSYPRHDHPDYCEGTGTITVPRPRLGPGSGNARLTWYPACRRPVGHTRSYALLPHLRSPVRASHDNGKIYELLRAQAGRRE